MMHLNRITPILALLLIAGFCAAAEPDQSLTPKATAQAFAKALATGDAAGAKALTTNNPEDGEILEALTAMIASMKHLNQAAIAKFGPEEARRLVPRDPGDEMNKHFNEAEEKVEGDSATLTTKNDKTPLALKKVAGQWKVDISSMPDRSEVVQALPLFHAMAKSADTTAAEIADSKYKSAEEAQKAFGTRMTAIMASPIQPATGPATKP